MSSPVDPPAVTRTARPVPLIIGVLLFADIISSFESTMMYNALPTLIADFQTTAASASWVLTAFLLVGAASAAVCGRLGDVYGRRRVLIVLLLVSAVGSIVSVATGTLTGVIIGRAIQGVSGGILPLCFGIARESLPRKHVPVAVAVIAGGAILSGAGGTIISGILIDALSWHYIFIVAAVTALVAGITAFALPISRLVARMDRIDWLGAVLFAPAIALVLFGVNGTGHEGWLSALTLGPILAGLALLAVWTWWELRVDAPMIDLRMFMNRKLALTMLATVFIAVGPFGITGFLLQVMMQSPTSAPMGAGLSATAAGALSFGTSIVGFLLAPVSGRISARAGSRRALMIGCTAGVLHAAAILFVYNGSLPSLIFSVLFLSVATSFMFSSLPNLIMESVPVENTSEATGVNAVGRTVFTGIGTSIATLLLSMSLVSGTRFSTRGAYVEVYLLIGICCLAALACAVFMRIENRKRPTTEIVELSVPASNPVKTGEPS